MTILSDKTLDFVSSTPDQTIRLGIRLGELLQAGDMLCLFGDLGAGKTALARGVGRGWGTAVRVTSPTYILVNEYPRTKDGLILYHIDCYRLENTADTITSGLDDILAAHAAWMIEWPQHIADLLPAERIDVHLRYVSEFKRGLRFEAHGERAEAVLKQYRRSTFGI